MKITAAKLSNKLLEIAKANAPVRLIKWTDGKGRKHIRKRDTGKKGTNMYSPYPGNLKNNGIYPISTESGQGICFDYDKVGYIGYANVRSHKPRYIEKTINDFCNFCVGLGGRIISR